MENQMESKLGNQMATGLDNMLGNKGYVIQQPE